MRLLLIVLLSFPAFACECARISVCELVRFPVLFIGEVVNGGVSSIRDDPWHNNIQHVRFRVIENFRGLPKNAQMVDVELAPRFGMCSPNTYFPGHIYLVSPSRLESKLFDGECQQGRDIDTAADDVRIVREYFTGKMRPSVHGRVAVAKADDLVDFELEQGEAKPVGGVRVTATGLGREQSTVTDPDGRHTLPLPSSGQYRVRAILPPYSSEAVDVSLTGACAVQDLALHIDNTISGHVLDENGKTMKKARVGLIDLDRPASPEEPHAWFRDAYTEQADASFQFSNVPIGRYLLIFNPDGPRTRGIEAGLLDESTFYPMGSNRANAKVIEIRSGGVHLTGLHLSAGKPVEFRDVTVRVHFPDGAPMDTAQIRCVASPVHPGELPWVLEEYVIHGQDGTLNFSAPANRQLQITVTDAYGRDLKGHYASTHAPGSAPIDQEFVVTP